MWIIPNNYPLYSAFAADMVASSEDLSLPSLNIESSLMWRSKPSQLRTWLQRWKRISWMQRLCGRILKPSHHTSFEEKLTCLLGATHVPHFQQQAEEKEKTTPDTCGHLSENISEQLDLLDASLKTSRDTSRLDSQQLSATWKRMVIDARSEYSARKKLAHRTDGSECLSWPTPTLNGNNNYKGASATSGDGLATAVKKWPTPSARGHKGSNGYQETLDKIAQGKRAHMGQLPNAVMVANKTKAHLNPDWVEQLMGVPLGWTALDGASNEWQYGWHDGSWEAGIPRVVESCDDRVDRIRLLGNGVVPATAAKAWITLGETNG